MSMLLQTGLDAVLSAKFELDCATMVWSEGEETLHGSGYIKQAAAGGFEFALFSKAPGSHTKSRRRFVTALGIPAGTLLPKETGGELRATDISGQEWIAVGLRPSWTVSQHQSLKGTARELSTVERTPVGASCLVEVRIAGRVDFPGNVPSHVTTTMGDRIVHASIGPRAADIRLSDAGLQARELTGGTSIILVADKPLPGGIEERIVGAVRFLENSPVHWCSLSRWENGDAFFRLRGDRYEQRPRFALPPLQEDDPDAYWRLFASLVDVPEALASTLQLWIEVATTAATWPLESRGLSTAIAVEALAGLLLGGFEPGIAGYTEDDELRARQVIEDAKLPDRLTRRLLGILQRRGASTADRLFELVRVGVANEEEVKAWKALRNPTAHGQFPPMGQELVDQVHRLRTLFNRLVFTAIGYDGPYTDYGRSGWPTAEHTTVGFRERASLSPPQQSSASAPDSDEQR